MDKDPLDWLSFLVHLGNHVDALDIRAAEQLCENPVDPLPGDVVEHPRDTDAGVDAVNLSFGIHVCAANLVGTPLIPWQKSQSIFFSYRGVKDREAIRHCEKIAKKFVPEICT